MPRLLLLGYFGAGNFGDDALLTDWLSRHAQWMAQQGLIADVVYNGADPLAGFIEGGRLQSIVGRLITKREALRLDPKQYQGVIAPGGSLLQDVTSIKSLLYYLWLVRRFASAGIPVFLLCQGIGPLISYIGRWLTPRELRRVRLLSLRDAESYSWLASQRALAGHSELYLACDPILGAALQPYPGLAPPQALTGLSQGYALVLPRATGDLPTPREATTEAQAVAQLLDHLRMVTGLEPVLYPMHRGRDAAFCAEISAASAGEIKQLQFDLSEPYRDSALWQALGGASLALSYRLHGLVCAAAQGVPALGVAYDPKVSSFCDAIGYPWCYPANVHHETTFSDLEQLWRQQSAVLEQAALRRQEQLSRLALVEERFHALW
jgi:polysaccharide pyruvyl transferase CsaB